MTTIDYLVSKIELLLSLSFFWSGVKPIMAVSLDSDKSLLWVSGTLEGWNRSG